jgi:pilus assembly protein CpaE
LLARAYAARGAEPATATGKVITVFSLRGGAGVTSLAVNLATALAQLFDLEVPLVDLALEAGSDSLMLDIMPKMNLSHLAKEDVNVVDDTLIREYLQVHPSGILLLAAPSTPVLAETVEPKTIHTLLPILRRMYTHVVIDTSHQWGDLNLATFDLSDLILLIIPPDMVSVRVATATLDTFASLGYPEEKTAVVINWVFPRRGLPQKEIETALGRPILAVIPHEPEGVVRSINEGVPMIIGQPTTAWSLAVEQLAYQIAAANVRARTDAAPSRRLAMLKKRLATG